jgi:rubrerythrin
MNQEEVKGLLYQALETERGGIQVYETALRCVVNEELRKEWEEYLEQTQNHVRVIEETLTQLGLDPEAETPGRQVVRHIGQSLVKAMNMARGAGTPEAAQVVAAECVVHAETKDHLNWELIGHLAKYLKGEEGRTLANAHKAVEDEEDEHLYHSTGWTRELWIETLGMPAVLPPPEETKEVKTAIEAARAKMARMAKADRTMPQRRSGDNGSGRRGSERGHSGRNSARSRAERDGRGRSTDRSERSRSSSGSRRNGSRKVTSGKRRRG